MPAEKPVDAAGGADENAGLGGLAGENAEGAVAAGA